MIVGLVIGIIAGTVAILFLFQFGDLTSQQAIFDSLSPESESTFYSIIFTYEIVPIAILVMLLTIVAVVTARLSQ